MKKLFPLFFMVPALLGYSIQGHSMPARCAAGHPVSALCAAEQPVPDRSFVNWPIAGDVALSQALERESIWPKGMMPDVQPHQIAAMTDEVNTPGFDPDRYREPYLEWYERPSEDVRNGSCMILISGGGYFTCCDVEFVRSWYEELTKQGVQCVKFVYRTPRPEGMPFWRTAWEDGQRAVRMVRSEAQARGFDPEKIGVISQSAGSHLALLLATSSQTPAYARIDDLDDVPCHINWAVVNSPAYITTDASVSGTPSSRDGYGPDVKLDSIFRFDEKTCPMSLLQGGADIYSPNGSTLVYRQLRRMRIPAEVHMFPDKPHGSYGLDRAVEFLRQMGYLGKNLPEENLMERYPDDDSRAELIHEDIWPEGKMPDYQEKQCKPYIEWHIPKVLKTTAIQIIWSGGGYHGNKPDGIGVAPIRRYLNDMGMTVVTMKYRTPRPEGLAKHTTAWEDMQRAIRIVRSEAPGRGLDPNNIGIMGGSAGGHLVLMGVTSSRHRSYLPIDDLDKIPCNVQWGVCFYPAYVLTDGIDGPNKEGGNDDSSIIVPDFSFDLDTSPVLFIHGDADGYSSMNSVKVWEKMRSMGVQCELHTLATRPHSFLKDAVPGTGSYTFMDRIAEFIKARVKFDE